MKLFTALRLREGDSLALMGTGGKTTALFRLADEAREHGWRVITATTVPMAARLINRAPRHLSAHAANTATLETLLAKHGHVLVTGPVDGTLGRAAGVSAGWLEAISDLPDVLIVETDEAPTFASLILPIMGLDELIAPTTFSETIRQLAVRYPHARIVPVLNKADTAETLDEARALAAHLLHTTSAHSVILGAAKTGRSAREGWGRVSAIVLAAGRSTRMGQAKPTLAWGEATILSTVLAQLQHSSVEEICVVTGAERAAVEALAAPFSKARCVFNPDFASSEMARSLQIGLSALPTHTSAALVALADQPQMQGAVIEQVLQRWRETYAPVVAPFFNQQRGHPLLFDRAAWPSLLNLPATANPREAIRALDLERVVVETDSVLQDIDTPDDYRLALNARLA